jgi:hypothetical protein
MPNEPNGADQGSAAGEPPFAASGRKIWSTPKVIASSAVQTDTMKYPEHESMDTEVHLS